MCDDKQNFFWRLSRQKNVQILLLLSFDLNPLKITFEMNENKSDF